MNSVSDAGADYLTLHEARAEDEQSHGGDDHQEHDGAEAAATHRRTERR
jgi:hypothetical protein